MPARTFLSARWVMVIMVAALVCSVAVVWGLIQITGNSPASSSTPAADPPLAGSGTPATARSRQTSGTPDRTDASTRLPATGGSQTATPPATESQSTLPGSALPLPAAWIGTAELTISVLGPCAEAGGTSSYTREAELALQQPAVGTGTFGDPNPLSLSLGITPAGVPGVSVYSASIDDSGAVHRTWWLTTGSEEGPGGEGRTAISGVLIDDQPHRGVLPPNLLVDNETDLQPCETSGSVRVPRTLAAGSKITGWVSPTRARLSLLATTVDGERAVTAEVALTRRPAP